MRWPGFRIMAIATGLDGSLNKSPVASTLLHGRLDPGFFMQGEPVASWGRSLSRTDGFLVFTPQLREHNYVSNARTIGE